MSGFVNQGLSVVTGVFIARMFGASGYGDLSFARSLTTILQLGTDFGITKIAVRKTSVDTKNYGHYLTTYLLTRLALSLLAYTILVFITFNSNLTKVNISLTLLYGLLIFANVFSVRWVFSAHQRMEFSSLSEIIDKILYVGLLFTSYYAFKSLFIVPVSMMLSLSLATCLEWYFLKTRFPGFKLGLEKAFMKELFIYSWPVGLSNGANMLNINLDTIFLKYYHGSAVTGEFNAAYRLILLIITAGSYFTMSLYPLMCERANCENNVMENTVEKSSRILIIFIIPAAFAFTTIGPRLLVLLFGEGFIGGGIALQILAWSTVFILLGRLYGNLMTALNKQNIHMIVMVISVVLKTALNFALIPRFSLIGVGISALTTELMIFFAVYFILKRQYQLRVMASFIKPLVAGAVMAVCLYKLNALNIFILIVIGPLVYFPVLLLIGGILREDRDLVMGIFREFSKRLTKR